MLLIFKAFDLSKHDHYMFWAVCNLTNFAILCSSELSIPNLSSFSLDVHLSLADTAIGSYNSPTCLHINFD